MDFSNSTASRSSADEIWPVEKKTAYFIIVVLMTIVGGIGNTLVIFAPVHDKHLKIPANVFVVNLACADMIVSVISNPFSLVALVHGESWFTERWILCEVVGDLCMIACTCSLVNIFMVALNRYIAVCHHRYYKNIYTWKKSLAMALLVWVFSCLVVLPTNHLGWVGNVFDTRYMICILDQHKELTYNYLWVFVLVVIPVIANAIFYLQIFLAVRRRRLAVIKRQMNPIEQSKKLGEPYHANDIKLAKTLFITYVAFVICWLPYAFSLLTDISYVWNPHAYMMVIVVAHGSSSGLNAILYPLTNSNFRRAYTRALTNILPNMCKQRIQGILESSSGLGDNNLSELGPITSDAGGNQSVVQCNDHETVI